MEAPPDPAAGPTVALVGPDPDSRRWLETLGGPGGADHDRAVRDLHDLLLRVARREAARRAGSHGIRGPELDDLAQQAADDAVVAVLRRLPDYAGRSRFTTWACKFAILEVAHKIGRHHWRRDGVALDPDAWESLPERLSSAPSQVAEARELLACIREIVETELTERQRHLFEAIVVNGTPLDVMTLELDTTRNAIYKAVFDIRAKLRRHLQARGLLERDEVAR